MNSGQSMSKLEIIKQHIAEQEIEAGRKKGSVKLIAVSKTKPMDQIKQYGGNVQRMRSILMKQ